MVKKNKRSGEERPGLIGDSIFKLLESMGGDPKRCDLVSLWQDWPEVVGENFASQVEIQGHKNGVLMLGVEDSVLMQELSYEIDEVLEKINDYLGEKYFKDIRINLKIR